MNARERLFAVLNREPVDRTPIWLLFPFHTTSYYADVRTLPVYRPIFEASKETAIMLNRRNPAVRLFAPEVREWDEVYAENGLRTVRHWLEFRGRRLYSETRHEKGSTRVKKLLTTDEDLEFFNSLPVNVDKKRIFSELDAQLPQYLKEKEEFPVEYGSMMLDLGEPVGALFGVSQLETYAMWSLSYSDLVVDFFDRVMQQKRLVYQYCLEHDMADVFFLVGSELASPPLVSRATFLRWIVPYATELIAMVHEGKKKVIQHYHGKIKRVLPDFITMKPDALHTIEAPPVGDCTFTEAFNIVGDSMALIGNIQYDDFRSYTTEQMAEAVRAVLQECRGKRLILSPSAGPYEQDISPRMVENYLTFLKTGFAG